MKNLVLTTIIFASFCLLIATPGWSPARDTDNYVKPKPKTIKNGVSDAQLELSKRIEFVPPLCSELWNVDNPVARKVGSDWVLVVPSPESEQYLMFGIFLPVSGPPVTTWHGGSLAGAIDHFCADQVPGELIN